MTSVYGFASTLEMTVKRGMTIAAARDEPCERRPGRLHERRMPGAGHVERDDALGARRKSGFSRRTNRRQVAADHDLARGVEIGQLHSPVSRRDRRGRNVTQRAGFQAEHGGHRPRGLFRSAVHRQTTLVDERERGLERQRAGDLQAAKFAERVAGRKRPDQARRRPPRRSRRW